MSSRPMYKRVLVKLSGEAMCLVGGASIDAGAMAAVAEEIRSLTDMGVQVGLVVGAGNILRGRDLGACASVSRATADSMGMLATVINALALRDALDSAGLGAVVMSSTQLSVCERFRRAEAIAHLNAGRVVVFAGGTGNPFFTTDTCAALRALEIDAELLIKATKVDGVYDSDPVANPNAKRYEELTYERVLADKLGVMDLTAVSMCMEHSLGVMVLQLSKPGNLAAAVMGQKVGTVIRSQ